MKFRLLSMFILLLFVMFLILDKIFMLKITMHEPSPVVYAKNGEILTIRLNKNSQIFLPTTQIPQILKQSVIAYEDRYFYYHFGINPLSIMRATFHNLTHKNRIGASTITMQVARMLNQNKRTYINKIKEIFIAIQLEWHYSKDEILTMYFNLAPYGGNIYGVKSAAKIYFNKELESLSYSQIALLSTIPKNPNKNRLDKISDIKNVKNRLLKELYELKILDKNQYLRAKAESVQNTRLPLPNIAPNYCDIAIQNNQSKTALDLDIQNTMQTILNKTMQNLKSKNANNAAAIIIDNQKMQVISFMGSHDQNAKNGQNNALNMRRNTGSTLKPFIYSLALDHGLITPKSELIDTEISISNYTPQNFLNSFNGIVNATDALALSLNIPFVNLNQKLEKNSLYEMLYSLDLISENKDFYGASIALGSAELSLVNLAHLYTIYANDGMLKPLNIAGKTLNNQKNSIQLISNASAYLSAKAMSEAARSHLLQAYKYAKNSPKIAFKTGTSYLHKDLWAIGVNQNYTIAVWIGNFNSESTDKLTGLNDASKVVFEMFKLLDMRSKQSFIKRPNGIITMPTCLDAFVAKECKNEQIDEHIVGVMQKNRCELISAQELNFMLKNAIITQDELKNSKCSEILASSKPQITHIKQDQIILSEHPISKIMIKCHAFMGDDVYIKIDQDEYFTAKNGDDIFIDLTHGKHSIKCLDDGSNQSEVNIQIRSLRWEFF